MADLETTAEEREAYAKAAETELVWPEAGFVERLLRDFDRLSAEIASLKAKLAEAEAEKAEIERRRAAFEAECARLGETVQQQDDRIDDFLLEKRAAVKSEREAWLDLLDALHSEGKITDAGLAAIRARGASHD